MPAEVIEKARVTVERATERERRDDEKRTAGAAKRLAIKRTADLHRRSGVHRFLFENGLALVAFALFALTFAGQVAAGYAVHNEEQAQHGEPPASLREYLGSGDFMEATTENWESEFLQMGLYVLLTAFLFQRGSSESKRIEEPEAVDQPPQEAKDDPDAPWPVRRGGLALALYRHSLSITLLTLFGVSLALHAVGGAEAYNEEQAQHGGPPVSALGYLATSRFWFESLQNWQSEFLAVGVLVVLSIWLREQGSPQSKPVGAGARETGE